MKSEHDILCNRLNNVNVFITDKHGTKKKNVDQTDLHLNQKWYHLGQVYLDSTSTTHPATTITVTNAGGEIYSQFVSVGNIKLVSQEMYQVSDVSFTEEQIAVLRGIFEILDTNNDGVLTIEERDDSRAFLESLGEQKNEAIVLIQDRFEGTNNFDQFLEIVEEEIQEAFALFSHNKGQIDINDFVQRVGLAVDVPSDDSSSLPLLLSPLVSRLLSLTPEQRLADISSFDSDGDGHIDFPEFTSAVLDSFVPFESDSPA